MMALLGLPSVLILISYAPLPFPLQLCAFIAVPLWFLGVRRGGQTLLIASPLLVALISMAYLPVSERAVGAFAITYVLGLFIVGVVGMGKLYLSVWRFMVDTRAMLRDVKAQAAATEPVLVAQGPSQKRTWTERLVRRFLGVSY